MKAYKKRFILDVTMIVMLIAAAGLIALMHDNMGEIKEIFIPEDGVYAILFNIGFRWSTIMGMAGIVLIQLVMNIMSYCNKKRRILIWSTGIWLTAAIVFEVVSAGSKHYIFSVLRNDLQYSNSAVIYTIGNYVDILIFVVLGIEGIVFLAKWIFGMKEQEQ